LAEIYAEDAQWLNANPNGPHCHNRDDIFTVFRQRMSAGIRIQFDELRSTLSEVLVTARAADFGAGGQRVQLPGTPHHQCQGLPLHGSRRGSARGTTPATDRAVVAPCVAAMAARPRG
jgi:hypothetical protein